MGHGDAIAQGELVNAHAEGSYLANNLMAKYHTRFDAAGGQLDKIGAAKTNASEFQQQFPNPWSWNGSRLQRRIFTAQAGDDIVDGRNVGSNF